MSGICGLFDTKGKAEVNLDILMSMMGKLIHRGPDISGYYLTNQIGLGFVGINGIDDSKDGKQPITNEDDSLKLVCNGSIYNHKEIRHNLELKGHKFKSNSDVEVIVHLYEEYGVDFLAMLNGQFAFALYDSNRNQMLCARDYAGVSPFFYAQHDGVYLFASEIKSILQYTKIQKALNLTALDQVMSFPGLISPATMFKDIYSLESGHYLLIDCHSIKKKEYWDLVYPYEDECSCEYPESYHIEKYDDLLTKAIQYRIKTDSSVGFYISGGLDSSLISAIIRKIYPDSVLTSFSLDFTDKSISESNYQKMMVERINSVHREKLFSLDDIEKRLRKSIYYAETPIRETYNTASLALSELVHKENINVVLTGEGADELLGGYVGYRFDKFNESRDISKIDKHELVMREKLWGDQNFIYEKDHYRYQNQKQTLYSEYINSIYNDIDCTNHFVINKDRLHSRSMFHKRSYVDFKLRMCDHLLSDHGDRMAYANSIEARYPFLDKDLIEFTRTMPVNMKLNGLNEKYILKRIAENIVPEKIINRPKFGFVAPGSPELIQSGIGYINDLLSYDLIKKQGYFNPNTVEALKKKYAQPGFKLGVPYENDFLITVITLGIFLQEFTIPDLL